jgi:hypothetical protein
MSISLFETPILFIIFNRPGPTLEVFNSIRSIQPAKLFIAADGPRAHIKNDEKSCVQARKIATSIDWDCNVKTIFQDHNMGCGLGPSKAITWFFENVQEGIILEDDCVPGKSFYLFCQTLLEYYRDNPQVMHISGDNFQYGRRRGHASYYFSDYTHNWGWATWKRAWQNYDFTLMPKEYQAHIWDAQWELSVKKQHGFAILPNRNLVKNIGFGPDATHTKTLGRYSNLDAEEIEFPLIHPNKISIDKGADKFTYYVHFREVSHPNIIWAYEFIDFLINARKMVQKIKIKIFGKLRT